MTEKYQPNILLITSDQQHWRTMGFCNPEIRTPNLDRLGCEGMVFDRAYCPNPTCTPARASIVTGQYPSQHGAWSLGTKLPESAPTLGDALQGAGYRTALIGKAHFQPLRENEEFRSLESPPTLQDLDFWRSFKGPFYGFQDFELLRNHGDEAHVGQHYALWLEEKGLSGWRDYFVAPTGTRSKGLTGAWELPEAFHYGTWIAERTCARIEQYHREAQPFFLWASFPDPHPPYLAPEPWASMYDPDSLTVPQGEPGEHEQNPPHFRLAMQSHPDFSAYDEPAGSFLQGFKSHQCDPRKAARDLATYYGMISLMDHHIGLILDQLERLGIAGDTLVVFTSDHGHLIGQHGLRHKGPFHYEDMIRVPMIARFPRRIPAGRRTGALQSLVDLAPTFLRAAGVAKPREMTGLDQHDVWFGEADSARDHVVVENHHNPSTVHLKTYVDERFKLTVYWNQPYGELFDLKEDPGERRNLWNRPEAARLKAQLTMKLLFAEMGKEPMWMPRLAGA